MKRQVKEEQNKELLKIIMLILKNRQNKRYNIKYNLIMDLHEIHRY